MRLTLSAFVVASLAATFTLTATPSSAKTAKECNAEYAANKDAIQGGGQKKKDFVAACKTGTETIPGGAATAPATVPTPATVAPAPAPTPTPTVAVRPKPAPTRAASGATNAGGFSTDGAAKAHCPSDTVVWVNTGSGVYHFAGTHNYGTTKQGDYMCEADAKAAGDRAAKNEMHP